MVYIEVWMVEEDGWANKLHRGSRYQSRVLQIVAIIIIVAFLFLLVKPRE